MDTNRKNNTINMTIEAMYSFAPNSFEESVAKPDYRPINT
jgi:hypothetical protein